MAKLSSETIVSIWTLLRQLSQLVEDANQAEYVLFEHFGETDSTIPYLTYLQNTAEVAAYRYSQLCNIRLRMGEAQPNAPTDMLRSLNQAITQNQIRIQALEHTLQEIKIEWNLP